MGFTIQSTAAASRPFLSGTITHDATSDQTTEPIPASAEPSSIILGFLGLEIAEYRFINGELSHHRTADH